MRLRADSRRSSLAGILLAVTLSACADPAPYSRSGSETFFPTWTPSGGLTPMAAVEGELIERAGCLFFDTPGAPGEYLPLWPDTLTLSGGSRPAITSPNGQVLEVGDRAALGGGERNLAQVEEMIGRVIPERCHAPAYWQASGSFEA